MLHLHPANDIPQKHRISNLHGGRKSGAKTRRITVHQKRIFNTMTKTAAAIASATGVRYQDCVLLSEVGVSQKTKPRKSLAERGSMERRARSNAVPPKVTIKLAQNP